MAKKKVVKKPKKDKQDVKVEVIIKKRS